MGGRGDRGGGLMSSWERFLGATSQRPYWPSIGLNFWHDFRFFLATIFAAIDRDRPRSWHDRASIGLKIDAPLIPQCYSSILALNAPRSCDDRATIARRSWFFVRRDPPSDLQMLIWTVQMCPRDAPRSQRITIVR